jgi:hypothetical protein
MHGNNAVPFDAMSRNSRQISPMPLWDKRRTARFLGVSIYTLDKWVAGDRGGPMHIKLNERLIRFRPDDVYAYLDMCARGGPPD